MGVNGIYGLSGSGIDVESMVKVGMLSKQKQYDKMQQTYTKNEWTKQAYNEIYNKITTFSTSTLSTYKMSSSMSAKSAISSNSDAVTATANGNAVIMNHKVQVDAVSSSAYLVANQSLEIINEDPSDESNSVQLQDYIFKQSTYNAISNELTLVDSNGNTIEGVGVNDVAFKFTIADGTQVDKKDANGNVVKTDKLWTFEYTYGELLGLKQNASGRITSTDNAKTFSDFVSDFNSLGTNIRASYDAVNGRFSFYNKEGGEANKIQFALSTDDDSNAPNSATNTATFFQGMRLAQSRDGELYGTDGDDFDIDKNYIGSLGRTAAVLTSAALTYTADSDDGEVTLNAGNDTTLRVLGNGYDFVSNFDLSINGTSIPATRSMTSANAVTYTNDDLDEVPINLGTKLSDLGFDFGTDFELSINGTQILSAASMTSSSAITYEDANGETKNADTNTYLAQLGFDFGEDFALQINDVPILSTPSMTSAEKLNNVYSTTSLVDLIGDSYDFTAGENLEFLLNDTIQISIQIDEYEVGRTYDEETGDEITNTETGFVYTDPDTGEKKYGSDVKLSDLIKLINAESDTTNVVADFSGGKFSLKSTVEIESSSVPISAEGNSLRFLTETLQLTNDDIKLGDLVDMINARSDETNVTASFDTGTHTFNLTSSKEGEPIELQGSATQFFTGADGLKLAASDITIGDLVDIINAKSDETNVVASFDTDTHKFKLTNNGEGENSLIDLETDTNEETLSFFNETLGLANDDVTIGDLVDMINAKTDETNVVASFNTDTHTFNLTSTIKGDNSYIDLASDNESTVAFFTENLQLAAPTVASEDEESEETSETAEGAFRSARGSVAATADNLTFGITGTNGSITIDGVRYDNLTNNSVTAYGVTYKLHNVTDSTVNVNIEQDTDAIVDKVKSFVEDYNTLLSSLYDKYNEKKYSDYSPLTTSQKETMKDEQIEKWEEKAKSGLLYHDQTLSKITTKMRNAISTPIDGLVGSYTSAFSIGISTTGIYGKLTLDEDKLRAALNDDSESVYNVISTLSEDDDFDKNGLAQRLGDVMVEASSLIKGRAGTDDSINDDSDLGSLMRELQNKMSDFKKLLDAFEDRLYKKYDAMEVALATLGTQLSYITGNQ